MKTTRLTAGCKINLYLKILSRREDGYHELRTLFYPLSAPFDTLDISAGQPGTGLRLTCSRPELETDSNLVAKAWRAYAQATGYAPDIAAHLTKSIPDGAGLGGGSSDAAALLAWLNDDRASTSGSNGGDTARNPLDSAAMNALAAKLGADVPFFLDARPAWAQGIGEQLFPARVDLSGFCVVLVCPSEKVPTAWAYEQWDAHHAAGAGVADVENAPGDELVTRSFLTTTSGEDMSPILRGPRLFNSFESAVFPHHPPLRRIKEELLAHGAAGALMSGSGSSIFGLFRKEPQAREAVRFQQRKLGEHGTAHLLAYHAGV